MWAAERVEQKKWRRDEEQRAAREDLIGRVGGSGGEERRGRGFVGVGRRRRIFPKSSAEIFLERAGACARPEQGHRIPAGGKKR